MHWQYSVIASLSSCLAKNNKIISMFVLLSRLLAILKVWLFFRNGGTNFILKQSNRMFLVNFSKTQQLSNNFFPKRVAILTKK